MIFKEKIRRSDDDNRAFCEATICGHTGVKMIDVRKPRSIATHELWWGIGQPEYPMGSFCDRHTNEQIGIWDELSG